MLCEAVSFSGVFVPGVFVRFLMPAGCTSRGISRDAGSRGSTVCVTMLALQCQC